MGVLSYIGLSHPRFAIHILLGLFSRFGLTVLILPFPLVNHFWGSDNYLKSCGSRRTAPAGFARCPQRPASPAPRGPARRRRPSARSRTGRACRPARPGSSASPPRRASASACAGLLLATLGLSPTAMSWRRASRRSSPEQPRLHVRGVKAPPAAAARRAAKGALQHVLLAEQLEAHAPQAPHALAQERLHLGPG